MFLNVAQINANFQYTGESFYTLQREESWKNNTQRSIEAFGNVTKYLFSMEIQKIKEKTVK